MTDYTDRAAAVTAALQDYARDIEADLGKIERNRQHDPHWGDVIPLINPGRSLTEFAAQKTARSERVGGASTGSRGPRLGQYQVAVNAAYDYLAPTGALTGPENTARAEAVTLIEAIQQITTHADAATLVATF